MKKFIFLAGCVLVAAVAQADERLNVKTGLWETTVTTKVDGNPIPKNVLDSMPPERRAKLEQAMAARAQKSEPKTTRNCVTEEDLKKGVQAMDMNGDCKKTILSQTSTHQEIAVECSRSGVTSKGKMTVDAPSTDTIKGKMELTVGEGKVVGDFNGKWIGATCPAGTE
jgi:uncharacterized protein DUF3617